MDLTIEVQKKLELLIRDGYVMAEEYFLAMINQPVKFSPRQFGFLSNVQRSRFFEERIPEQVVAMIQNFIGEPSGDAFLFLDQAGSNGIIHYLDDVQGNSSRITISDREALLEIGGILINSFLSVFGDSIQFKQSFVKPRIIINPGKRINDQIKNNSEKSVSLFSEFDFNLKEGRVLGQGTILISGESLLDGFLKL